MAICCSTWWWMGVGVFASKVTKFVITLSVVTGRNSRPGPGVNGARSLIFDEAAGLVGGFAGLVEVASLGHPRTLRSGPCPGQFDGGVHPAGSDGPPPNVEIALVAEDVDAADRIAVDAGGEQFAPPTDKLQGQRVGYVRDPFGMLVELATPL